MTYFSQESLDSLMREITTKSLMNNVEKYKRLKKLEERIYRLEVQMISKNKTFFDLFLAIGAITLAVCLHLTGNNIDNIDKRLKSVESFIDEEINKK
jgi:hypothetical protein